ncbi:MAG TPA: TrbI/VirB10 family protein [Terriglobales bacterium]|nr:TrbI/VirB10 family protein [Terriglobales bacterium]
MRLQLGLMLALACGLAAGAQTGYQGQNQYPNQDQAQNQNLTRQARAVRSAGYNAGYRDGVSDYRNQSTYNFQDHRAYRDAADQRGESGLDRRSYQMAYRTGYESGYDDGFYGRAANADTHRQRDYDGAQRNAQRRDQNDYGYGAQPNAQPSRRSYGASDVLPAGTALHLRLNNTLSTRSSEQGDTFSASVTDPVYAPDGQTLLVPDGSTVQGTVASVERSGSVSGNSQLQLNFQSLVLPDGTRLPLRAEVSQVNPNQSFGGAITGQPTTTNEGGVERSQTRNAVGTAAAGGVVGAIVGALAGGGKGAGIGAIVGGGLGLVLANRNGNLDLQPGTPITITLDRPIHIR